MPNYDVRLPFDYQAKWYEGDFNPAKLLRELSELPDLQPFPDDLGNLQGAVRLDEEPDIGKGIWITIPAEADIAEVDAVVATHDPAADPTPELAETPEVNITLDLSGIEKATTVAQLRNAILDALKKGGLA